MISNEPVYINSDGETSRDFCHIENAIQANLLAALVKGETAINEVYNVAVGGQTTLNQLFEAITQNLIANGVEFHKAAIYSDFRSEDIRHSVAEIDKARRLLAYQPVFDIVAGLAEAIDWYKINLID